MSVTPISPSEIYDLAIANGVSPSSVTSPSSSVTSSSLSSEASFAKELQSQQNQLTIDQADADLRAEGQPIPKNLTVSQAQQIINEFQRIHQEIQSVA